MQEKPKETRALIDLVKGDARFRQFGEFLKAAELDKKVSGGTKLTLFIPTDEAFDKLTKDKKANLLKPENREQLRNQLLLHMAPGALEVGDLKARDQLNTEAGQKIGVLVSANSNNIKLANANVMLPREEATDGYIYPLDALIQPASQAAAVRP